MSSVSTHQTLAVILHHFTEVFWVYFHSPAAEDSPDSAIFPTDETTETVLKETNTHQHLRKIHQTSRQYCTSNRPKRAAVMRSESFGSYRNTISVIFPNFTIITFELFMYHLCCYAFIICTKKCLVV